MAHANFGLRSREGQQDRFVAKIGDSVGIPLPNELLANLKLQAGDTVLVTETADGLLLSPFTPGLKEESTANRE